MAAYEKETIELIPGNHVLSVPCSDNFCQVAIYNLSSQRPEYGVIARNNFYLLRKQEANDNGPRLKMQSDGTVLFYNPFQISDASTTVHGSSAQSFMQQPASAVQQNDAPEDPDDRASAGDVFSRHVFRNDSAILEVVTQPIRFFPFRDAYHRFYTAPVSGMPASYSGESIELNQGHRLLNAHCDPEQNYNPQCEVATYDKKSDKILFGIITSKSFSHIRKVNEGENGDVLQVNARGGIDYLPATQEQSVDQSSGDEPAQPVANNTLNSPNLVP